MNSVVIFASIVFAAILLAVAVTYLRWRREYDDLTAADLKQKADLLLRRGHDGGFMVISERRSGRFVQLRKYVHRKGEFGLELGFPNAPWSATYYDRVLKLIEDDAIPVVVQPTNDAPVTEFLLADFGRDTERLASIVSRIFYEIFDTPKDRRFRVKAEGIDAKDVLVDTPTQAQH
jgi:hypothetical protein